MGNRLIKCDYTEDNESAKEMNISPEAKTPDIKKVNNYSSEFKDAYNALNWEQPVKLTKKEQKELKTTKKLESLRIKGNFPFIILILSIAIFVFWKLGFEFNSYFVFSVVMISIVLGIGINKAKETIYEKKIKHFEKNNNKNLQEQSKQGDNTVLSENKRCRSRFRY